MTKRSPVARLTDIIEAIELIQSDMAGVTLDAFEADLAAPGRREPEPLPHLQL